MLSTGLQRCSRRGWDKTSCLVLLSPTPRLQSHPTTLQARPWACIWRCCSHPPHVSSPTLPPSGQAVGACIFFFFFFVMCFTLTTVILHSREDVGGLRWRQRWRWGGSENTPGDYDASPSSAGAGCSSGWDVSPLKTISFLGPYDKLSHRQ